MAQNYFRALDVSPHCSGEDVKRSFRRLALQHHPDKGGQTERFQEINNAYEVLSDPIRRSAHAQAVLGTRYRHHSGASPFPRGTHWQDGNHGTSEGGAADAESNGSQENEDQPRASRAEDRNRRRFAAEEAARDREKQRKEEELLQNELRRQRKQKNKQGTQTRESNAERLHREHEAREAWKAECRRRRREGEAAARMRAEANAERRQAQTM